MIDLEIDGETLDSFKSKKTIFRMMGVTQNFIFNSIEPLFMILMVISAFSIVFLFYFIRIR
jgi:hypothetical protein